MNRLLRPLAFFRPDLPRIGGVGLLMFGSVGAGLLKPWPLAIIVDAVIGDSPLPPFVAVYVNDSSKPALILIFALALLSVHVLQGLLSALQNYAAIKVGLRGLTRVRNAVFACLQRLSMRFHQGSRSGDLIFRAAWDTYSFQTLFQQGLVTFASAGLSLALMVIVMWQVNRTLTLAALAVMPLLLIAIQAFGRPMRERGMLAQQADSQVTSLVQQSITALPLIQSCVREQHEEQRFNEHVCHAEMKRLSQHGSELLYWLAITLVFALGTAGIVWLGANQVLAGALTVGELLVFVAYLAQLYEPLNQLSHVGATIATATAATERVFELLDTPEEVRDAPGARPVANPGATAQPPGALIPTGRLSFDRVSFGYENDRPVLREVTFDLQPGESCAIVGPSGAGKSTLLNLVPRFFDPISGAVRLDGIDLRELRLRDLRRQVALVMQEPILLPASIAENIAYGKPDASADEIEAAARAANAHEFIATLPQDYGTIVGEAAARLSVGERQRINLARAFLKNAPILLLDEPTSALDAESEAKVVASIFDLMRGRTTLMVAHRLSTIQRADKILVLEAGRAMAFGPRQEVSARDGYFRRLSEGAAAITSARARD